MHQGDFVWLVEVSDKQGYYILGRITENIAGSEGAIWLPTILRNDGSYWRPIVKLARVLPVLDDIITTKSRADGVGAELAELASFRSLNWWGK